MKTNIDIVNSKQNIVKDTLISLPRLIHLFFILILLELFLMGSGRFFEIGSLTLRMIFFLAAISLSFLIYFHKQNIKNYVLWLFMAHLSILSFSSFVGFLNGADSSMVFEDVKPLVYFFMILPFAIFIKNYQSIMTVVNVIKIAAFIMMVIYMVWLFLIYFGFLDFSSMYQLISDESSDIMFRGANSDEPGFFYKGFLYLNIGFIFFLLSPKKIDKIIAFFILIAIVLTFTRGFIVALLASFIILSIIEFRKKKSFVFLIIITSVVIVLTPMYISFVGDRNESDFIRFLQLQQVVENINIVSLFIGHGFGIGIPIRPMHMEIAYLEIFHKQGLIGLFFWLYIFWFILNKYLNIKNKDYIVKSFFLGSIFVFMQSFTNPFLNNPIGMSMILITMISLSVIEKNEKENQ